MAISIEFMSNIRPTIPNVLAYNLLRSMILLRALS